MLTLLQKAAGTWVAKILLGLLVVSFAVWGISGASLNFASGSVASVGSKRIATIDFQRELFLEMEQFGRQIGRPLTPAQARQFGLPQRVLSRMINQATLDDRVSAFGIGVSEDKVADELFKDPIFQNNKGDFDAFRYQQIVSGSQLTEKEFLKRQAQSLSRQQLVDGLTGDFHVSDVWKEVLKDYSSEERTLDVVTLDRQNIQPVAEPSEDDLKEYFNQHKGQYRAPEYRSLKLLSLDIKDFDSSTSISDEKARAEYDDHLSRYVDPEKREVKRITFQSDSEAESARKELEEGKTFQELQQELGLSDEDVSLGLLEKGQILDTKLAEAAFNLPIKTASGIIEGDFGKAIVFVERAEGGKTQSFEDVKATIKHTLSQDQNRRALSEKVDAIEDARAEGNTFEEIAKKLDVKLSIIPPISRTGELEATGTPMAGIPAQESVLDEAFNSDIGLENDVIENGRTGFVWLEVTNIKEARERPFEEVKDRVKTAWMQAAVTASIVKKAKAVKDAISPTNTLADVARAEGLSLETIKEVKRDQEANGLTRAAVDAAFNGPKGFSVVAPSDEAGRSLVLQVTDIKKRDLGTEIPGLSHLQEGIENDVLNVYINLVREREGSSFNAETFAYVTDPEAQRRQNHGSGGY